MLNMGIFNRATQTVSDFVASRTPAHADSAAKRKSIEKIAAKPAALDNLIVFINGYHSTEERYGTSRRLEMLPVARVFADGLQEAGYRVCTVERSRDWAEDRRTATIDTNRSLNPHEIRHFYIDAPSDLKKLCQAYDFVLLVDGTMTSLPDVTVWNRWKRLGTRFVVPHAGVPVPESLHERTVCVYVGWVKEGFLSVDYTGDAVAHHSTRWDDKTHISVGDIPVVAYYYEQIDPQRLAAAIMGVSDPRLYYVDHYAIKKYQRMTKHYATTWAGVINGILGGAALFAGAGPLDSLLLVVLASSVPLVATLGVWQIEDTKKEAMFSIKAASMRKIEHIFPIYNGTRYTRQLTIKPMLKDTPLRLTVGTSPDNIAPPKKQKELPSKKIPAAIEPVASSTYASDLMWAKVVKRHDVVTAKWVEYELNITKMLDAPLITDYSCPQTAALYVASVEAQSLKAVASDPDLRGDQPLEVARTLYAESVTRLEVAFNVAEAYAIKQGIRGFAEAEQRKIARSKQLFAIAFNSSASEAERASAIVQARKTLEGVLVINERAVQQMLDSAQVRPLISA